MPLHRPSAQSILKELKCPPKKGLSQNFMIDGNIVNKIIKSASIQKGDVVLEIGPGIGALTEALLKSDAKIIAIEKDSSLAKRLIDFKNNNLEVIEGDFLTASLKGLKISNAKVVSNLPYNISTEAIRKLLQNFSLFSSITLTLQKEFALKLVAKPKSSNYSFLTIFTAYYSYPQIEFFIPKRSFFPKPNIDSALVTFLPKKSALENPAQFLDLVKTAFTQRRKTLPASLLSYGKQRVVDGLHLLGLSEKKRPQELSLEEFLQLFHYLEQFHALPQ